MLILFTCSNIQSLSFDLKVKTIMYRYIPNGLTENKFIFHLLEGFQ